LNIFLSGRKFLRQKGAANFLTPINPFIIRKRLITNSDIVCGGGGLVSCLSGAAPAARGK